MREGHAQGSARDLNQSCERRVHFENQEDRARDRERTDDERRDDCRVGRREEPEAPYRLVSMRPSRTSEAPKVTETDRTGAQGRGA
jgi:hypothetical protein